MSKRNRNGRSTSNNCSNNSNTNKSGNSANAKGKSRRTVEMENDFKGNGTSKSNDASWYAASPALLSNAANINFPYATGSKFEFNYTGAELKGQQTRLPGIYTQTLMPTVGNSKIEGTSPINMAANNVYSFVRHMNSGSANYDAPDLMIYLLAMDSCYSYYAFLTRIYGVMRYHTPLNYYRPKAIVEAMNVDYDDIEKNLPQLLFYINLYANKLSTLKIPNTMPYLTRHMWMYSGFYSDEDSDKAQYYMYVPDGFYQYHETPGEDTKLLGNLTYKKFEKVDRSKFTYDDLIKFGNELLDVNRSSEDHNIMSGDIMKAYQGNVFTVPQISADYEVKPTCDEEVISQMHNAVALPAVIRNNGVVQDPATGVLYNDITLSSGGGLTKWYTMDAMLDMHKSDPSPADVMVATRLMCTVESKDDSTFILHSCGSEVVTSSVIYYFNENGIITPSYLASCYEISDNTYQRVSALAYASQFRQCPIVRLFVKVPDTTQYFMYNFGDIYNMTKIDRNVLAKMHEVALLSEFGV